MNGDFRIGPWLVQPSLNSVSQNGTSTRLETKVMEVLVCLADQSGHVVSKERLLQAVWPDTFVTDDVLKRSISELRRVFKDDAHESQIIETIPKRGYRLLATVERVTNSSQKIVSATEVSETRGHSRGRRWKATALAGAAVLMILIGAFGLGGLRSWLPGDHVPAIRSLAVLPLQSLSDDPKQEYFAEGVTDALITNLAQIGALRVVSRTTAMGYGRPNKPLPQISRELKVDGIVEGTVQRSGDHVRITAQLIYGPADQHLWANSFEREVKDVLELENTIASEVANEVRVTITPGEQSRLKNIPVVNPKALDAYLEARFHIDEAMKREYYKGKQETVRHELHTAVLFLNASIQDDPSYAPAYVAYGSLVDSENTPTTEFLPQAKSALVKAVQLFPNNADAHIALANFLRRYEYDWVGAEQEYRKAIDLSPNSADAHFQYADYLSGCVGRDQESKEQQSIAQSLDPARDYSWICCDTAHVIRKSMSVDEEAMAVDQKAPDDPVVHGVLAKDYAIQGRYKESVERYEQTMAMLGWDNFATVLRNANAKDGPKLALEEWMRAGEEYSRTHDDLPVVVMAFTYSSLGDKDRAFAWLDKAVEQRSWIIIHLKDDDVWRPLRSDPRFADLLRRVGLPVS